MKRGQTSILYGAQHLAGRAERREQQVQAAAQQSALTTQLAQLAQSSRVRQRDQETFEGYVADAADNAGVDTVYVSGRLLQQSGLAEAVSAISPAVADQLAAAAATGGDVAIPMAEFASRILTLEGAEALREHIRYDPDGMTLAEAREFEENGIRQEFDRDMERYVDQEVAAAAIRDQAEAVKRALMNEIAAQPEAVRFAPETWDAYSTIVGNFYATTAQRIGTTAEELYERMPLRVAFGQGEGFSQSLASQPPKGWKAISTGEEAAALWEGTETGNAVFFPELSGKLAEDAPELAGYSHSLDRSAVTHMKNRHGRAETESLRGQIAVTAEDVARIPEIVTGYDAVSAVAGENNTRLIAYAKKVGDGVLVYLERVSSKRRNLSGITMWKFQTDNAPAEILANVVGDKTKARNGGLLADALRSLSGYQPDAQTPSTPSSIDDAGVYEQTVWHGSPHRHAGFSLQHIGTGEGAHVYGWGMYFASQREIAESYREKLSTLENTNETMRHPDAPGRYEKTNEGWEYIDENGDLVQLDARGYEAKAFRAYEEAKEDADAAREELRAAGETEAEEFLKALEPGERGQLYRVEIPEDTDLLDWDATLDEQPEKVRAALEATSWYQYAEDDAERRAERRGENATGQDIYRWLLEEETPQEASEMLLAAGIPGLRYLDGNSRRKGEGSHNYVIWDEAAMPIEETYYQGARAGFDPETLTIRLLEPSDLSSFLHEAGHFFLEMQTNLALDIATLPESEVTPGMRAYLADSQAVFDWFGITMDQWTAMTLDERRPYHEQFAEGFERYLFEGNAPSVELKTYFERFTDWLKRIYQSLSSIGSGNELNAEVRAVFDRMLATDAEIDNARAIREQQPCSRSSFFSRLKAGVRVPRGAVFEHGVEDGEELAHGGDEGDFEGFALSDQTPVEIGDGIVVADGA